MTCYGRFTGNKWICDDYVRDRWDEIVDATVSHLGLTVSAVLLGIVLALPLALLARRSPRLEAAVLGVASGIYTIPSLALLPLLVPFTGLTATTVVIGLALYCLTILVRAFLDGLRAVPDDVKESAIGLGYGRARLLTRIELPLALPVVLAGVRVATVSTVALATVGTIVAHGGLGDLINHGRLTDFKAELLTASVLCVMIALFLDGLLLALQHVLTPWARTRGLEVSR
ncbi:osmoprotectant transport system permease protein [Nocardioides thalensis]|uniref:Osmoprotectant transport system permease protein n=1 Tax=Nocardioides thalensis TaxID=1914755 RepID=A0A853BWM2_9ACTN|nr:ABC transporter permease [Nocardioides thalensis]NYI99473.1 osmoprotectant transport system permease protein [Nocardioides thalensis]